MATKNSASSNRSVSEKSKNLSNYSNLESFACLWLDQNVDSTQDNRDTQKELRHVINHLRTFDDSDACEQYVHEISQEKVVLIVSGMFGRQVVPRLHDLPQFSACYVFCQDKKSNEKWAKNYSKVNGVFVERAKLLAQISTDHIARAKLEDGASISVVSSGSQSLQARNASFMWFQLFIEVLIRMHHKSSERKELIGICKQNYQGNNEEMRIINEFEKNYKSDDAIRWYTRESCLYRMLNKALRVQNFDVLFALRVFITDIAIQLKGEYEKFIRTSDTRNTFRVYRGQLVGNDELNLIENSIGEFLSMNSFLSTSRDRSTAFRFAREAPRNHGTQKVIFDIEINPRLETKAFADVSKISYFMGEDEILIMLGALFRIEKVIEDKKDQLWVVHVCLASEDDYHLKEMFSYMKQTIGDETDLDSLGKILIEMGEYGQAQKCYRRMCDETELLLGNAKLGLGKAYLWAKEDESLDHLNKALQIRQQLLDEDHVDVGECYSYIGMVHWGVREDYDQALSYLKKSIAIQEKTLPSDSLALARTYNNIEVTYDCINEYDLALQYYDKALTIRQKILPSNHPQIASIYNNIGKVYEGKGDHSKALQYYEKSLDMKRKTLPPTHEYFIMTENNIRRVRGKMKK